MTGVVERREGVVWAGLGLVGGDRLSSLAQLGPARPSPYWPGGPLRSGLNREIESPPLTPPGVVLGNRKRQSAMSAEKVVCHDIKDTERGLKFVAKLAAEARRSSPLADKICSNLLGHLARFDAAVSNESARYRGNLGSLLVAFFGFKGRDQRELRECVWSMAMQPSWRRITQCGTARARNSPPQHPSNSVRPIDDPPDIGMEKRGGGGEKREAGLKKCLSYLRRKRKKTQPREKERKKRRPNEVCCQPV